jgi:hypothetical protein
MTDLMIRGSNINELIIALQNLIDQEGVKAITSNIFLLPEELAERWRIETTCLGNWRVKGDGPMFMKLSEGLRAKVRYPLFGEKGIAALEAQRLRSSTSE